MERTIFTAGHEALRASVREFVELDRTAFVDRRILDHTRRRLGAVDAATAKWWTASVQNDVPDACVQLHGGYGSMNEYPVGRARRDPRVTRIRAGSSELMRALSGRDLGR